MEAGAQRAGAVALRSGAPVPDPADLTLSPSEMALWVQTVLMHILDHEAGLADADVLGDVSGRGLRAVLPHWPSQRGEDPVELLRTVFGDLVPRSANTASPGHFGWIPSGGVFPAAVADLISGAVNRYTGMYQSAPALVQLEADVLRWFCEWFGYPAQARGVFTSGGSLANFAAVICARESRCDETGRAVVYASTDAHLSVAKGIRLAGFPPGALRSIPVDGKRRMRPDLLSAAIAEDRSAEREPFLVVATAGTTYTGAVDPLHAIADVVEREGLWLHVDAAYGGFFRLVPELGGLLDGLSRADSLTVDPHKSLFLPYGTGALLVRNGALLPRAFGTTGSYLPTPSGPDSDYDPYRYGPAMSRDFPGLRVWLTVQSYGVERLVAAIGEKYRLARSAAARLHQVPHLELVTDPELSLFAFRVRRPGFDPAEDDAATRDLIGQVCSGGRALLTGCHLDGRDYARVCVLSFRSRARHVESMVSDIITAAREIVASRCPAAS
jgi:aromatic-L-amino-acid decarboxylase